MLLQFKIQLKGIDDPPVWRRLVVPEQFTFLRFHKAIQAAFGWEDYHLFQFSDKGYLSDRAISIPNEMDEQEIIDAKNIKLSEIFTHVRQKYLYIYDFGDDWTHEIKLEKITDVRSLQANCLEGEGACPPEDCGGIYGYAHLKQIMAHPAHPEHREMKQWLGISQRKKWDVTAFDLQKTNVKVSKI